MAPRAILDPKGEGLPLSARGPLEEVRFRKERAEDRDRQLVLRLDGKAFSVRTRPNRTLDSERPFFERDWPAWLTGAIYAGPRGPA